MNEDEILQRVQMVVRDQLDEDDIVLTPETRASAVDGWDSLAHVRIMVAIEEAFGVRFDTSEITTLENVGALVALVRSKL